ncbi:hypothetical protein FRC14_003335 [Serendipita sp. 396]|nr:hypothetical protein FRC14_003335 [Serendipita sp. 396]KAG8780104.1 hypothetical protein FRC15_009750 [Serendipita sp. 397]KAG8799455.1 hypothetical protein FRC16_005080 [Serendipita sp. 398]KAG8819009.1 hypothetical protein FRC18_012226 [Serendipita sp. 400]KAG8846714.1 hypothetical protein FRB91_000539 [Serendipita sp. 411]KAG8855195.1 hypothetical protein FRC20_000833 [Serendipita sp. 405]
MDRVNRALVLNSILTVARTARDTVGPFLQPPEPPPPRRRSAQPKLTLPRIQDIRSKLRELNLTDDVSKPVWEAYRHRAANIKSSVKEQLKAVWKDLNDSNRLGHEELTQKYHKVARTHCDQLKKGLDDLYQSAVDALTHLHDSPGASTFDARWVPVLQWVFEHTVGRYPSKDQRKVLAQKTALSYHQITRWFKERRERAHTIEAVTRALATRDYDPNNDSVPESSTHASLDPENNLPAQAAESDKFNPLEQCDPPPHSYPEPMGPREWDVPVFPKTTEWPRLVSDVETEFFLVAEDEVTMLHEQLEIMKMTPPELPTDIQHLCSGIDTVKLTQAASPVAGGPSSSTSSVGSNATSTSSESTQTNTTSIQATDTVAPLPQKAIRPNTPVLATAFNIFPMPKRYRVVVPRKPKYYSEEESRRILRNGVGKVRLVRIHNRTPSKMEPPPVPTKRAKSDRVRVINGQLVVDKIAKPNQRRRPRNEDQHEAGEKAETPLPLSKSKKAPLNTRHDPPLISSLPVQEIPQILPLEVPECFKMTFDHQIAEVALQQTLSQMGLLSTLTEAPALPLDPVSYPECFDSTTDEDLVSAADIQSESGVWEYFKQDTDNFYASPASFESHLYEIVPRPSAVDVSPMVPLPTDDFTQYLTFENHEEPTGFGPFEPSILGESGFLPASLYQPSPQPSATTSSVVSATLHPPPSLPAAAQPRSSEPLVPAILAISNTTRTPLTTTQEPSLPPQPVPSIVVNPPTSQAVISSPQMGSHLPPQSQSDSDGTENLPEEPQALLGKLFNLLTAIPRTVWDSLGFPQISADEPKSNPIPFDPEVMFEIPDLPTDIDFMMPPQQPPADIYSPLFDPYAVTDDGSTIPALW